MAANTIGGGCIFIVNLLDKSQRILWLFYVVGNVLIVSFRKQKSFSSCISYVHFFRVPLIASEEFYNEPLNETIGKIT